MDLDPEIMVRYSTVRVRDGAPRKFCMMQMVSRVPQQTDTKLVIDSKSSAAHLILIVVKWRPPGRASNGFISNRAPSILERERVPVNFGDVDGKAGMSVSSGPNPTNSRSSGEGKEQMRLKTSECGTE